MSASVEHFFDDSFKCLPIFDPLPELNDVFLADSQTGQPSLGLAIPEEIRPMLVFLLTTPAPTGCLAASEINSAKSSGDRQIEMSDLLLKLMIGDICRHPQNISLHYYLVKIYFQSVDKKVSLTIQPVRLGGLPLIHAVAQKLGLMKKADLEAAADLLLKAR